MRERGFLEEERKVALDLIASHKDEPLISVYSEELISHAVAKMRKHSISQIPVLKDDKYVGSLNDTHTYQFLIDNPDKINASISSIMQKPFPVVNEQTSIEEISKLIDKETPAVLVEQKNGKHHIITRQDIINSFA
jgi:cystathionine beta-synthase